MSRPKSDAAVGVQQTLKTVQTTGRGFTDVTSVVRRWLAEIAAGSGTVSLFIRHTSASLVIQENTDPDVQRDLADALDRLAPEDARWRHALEGPDDMPAHVKSALTATSLTIPVMDGNLALGTWQAIYVAEHRRSPHNREVILTWTGTREE